MPRRMSPQCIILILLLLLFPMRDPSMQVLAAQQFNFEIIKGVQVALDAFLYPAVAANRLGVEAYALGTFRPLGERRNAQLHYFTSFKTFETTDMVYGGFENSRFGGYIRSTPPEKRPQWTEISPPNPNRTYFWADNVTGQVTSFKRNRVGYDPRKRTWYILTKLAQTPMWSPVYEAASTGALVVTLGHPIFKPNNGSFAGVLAVDYSLASINSFLIDTYGDALTTQQNIVVFIAERSSGLLIGTSLVDQPLLADDDARILAADSTIPGIAVPAEFLMSLTSTATSWPEIEDVHDGFFLQSRDFTAGAGLEWSIVVSMRVDCPEYFLFSAAERKCIQCKSGETAAPGAGRNKAAPSGARPCIACAPGRFKHELGSQTCLDCPAGWSQPNEGSQACIENPGLKPDDCGDLQYLVNKNPDPSAHESWHCDVCPKGGSCEGPVDWHDIVGAANSSRIRPQFGWGRCPPREKPSAAHMFERCPFAAACLGAPNPNLEDQFEGGVATQNHSAGCNKAYRKDPGNFLCSGCAPGFSRTAGDLSGKCDQCPGPGENKAIAILGIMIALIGVTVYVKITLNMGGDKDASDGVKSIFLSFVQILSLLTTFPIRWPTVFTVLFRIGGAITVLGQHMVNLKCMFPERSEAEVFYSSRVAWAFFPPCLSVSCVLVWWMVEALFRCGGASMSGDETSESPTPEQPVVLTLRKKVKASVVALLYLIWPGLCSETFAMFACRRFCGDDSDLRLNVDLGEICFQGRHAAYIYALAVPMLLIYVIGLPMSAIIMVQRLRRRARRKKRAVHSCKGHSTWGLFYSVFRDKHWWWEGTVALRKICIAMIGVFGASLESIQVSLTMVLVFFVILLTAVKHPYGDEGHGNLLHRLEVSTLVLLFLTLWAASVFAIYPRCELSEGKTLWWCDMMAMVIGVANSLMLIATVLLFVWLTGAVTCLNHFFGELRSSVRVRATDMTRAVRSTSLNLSWGVNRAIHRHADAATLRHVQHRLRGRTVSSANLKGTLVVNPLEASENRQCGRDVNCQSSDQSSDNVEMVELQIGEPQKTKQVDSGYNSPMTTSLAPKVPDEPEASDGAEEKSSNRNSSKIVSSKRGSYDRRMSAMKRLRAKKEQREAMIGQ